MNRFARVLLAGAFLVGAAVQPSYAQDEEMFEEVPVEEMAPPAEEMQPTEEQVAPLLEPVTEPSPAAMAVPTYPFAYGVQAHMWHFGGGGKERVADMVVGAGLGWVKHQVEWSTVEVAPGEYDFGELDQIVQVANERGLKVLLSIAHAPTFHRNEFSGLMPADNATFNALMQTLASRYAGRVQAYELWNEQNLDRETGPGNVNPAAYLELLKAGYTGVKAGDPNALALLGATSPTGANIPGVVMDDVEYLNQLYAINGGEVRNYFDALGAHPSGFSNPPDCGPTTPECSLSGGFNDHPSFFAFYRVSQYYDVMVANGDTEKKIWFTEFGYAASDMPVPGYEYAGFLTEQQQAEFLVRAFQKARELPYVGGMIVWNLNYQVAVPKTDEKWSFGLIREDWSPRPAYLAVSEMIKP